MIITNSFQTRIKHFVPKEKVFYHKIIIIKKNGANPVHYIMAICDMFVKFSLPTKKETSFLETKSLHISIWMTKKAWHWKVGSVKN